MTPHLKKNVLQSENKEIVIMEAGNKVQKFCELCMTHDAQTLSQNENFHISSVIITSKQFRLQPAEEESDFSRE